MRLDIRYRTRFDYDDPGARVAERAAGLPGERRAPAAHLVPGHDDAGVTRLLVHRLLGHPGRRVRRARAARVARGRRRGVGRDRAARRCSPSSPHSTSCRGDEFREEHLEYLQPIATRRVGAGRGRRGAPPARRSRAPTSSASCSRSTGRSATSLALRSPGSTDVGVEVEEVLGRGRGVCQDFAHLAVAMCRSRASRRATCRATCSRPTTRPARIPTPRWCACRPTPGSRPPCPASAGSRSTRRTQHEVGLRHVKIGHGRDYDDVPPLRGVVGGEATPSLGVAVDIRRLRRRPSRPTPRARPRPRSSGSPKLGNVGALAASSAQQAQQ